MIIRTGKHNKKIPEVNINWSPKKLEKYLNEEHSWILELDDDMSPKALENLFKKHISSPYCCEDIIGEIAEHKNTPTRILRFLSKIASDDILSGLALNPKITEEIANIIIEKTENYVVLEHLIHNPKVTDNVLGIAFKRSKDAGLRNLIRSVRKSRELEQKAMGKKSRETKKGHSRYAVR